MSDQKKPNNVTAEIQALILQLHSIGALKFGSFTLKSGLQSPFYVDLRITVSHPNLLSQIADALLAASASTSYHRLCGVPYTALPFATVMCIKSGTPMVMRRKEAKAHGTKRLIEGTWHEHNVCLIVEDLVTSGMSVLETVRPLTDVGLKVTDVVVLLDRQQGARDNLSNNGLNLHAVFTVSDMLDVLVEEGKIESTVRDEVVNFTNSNKVQTGKQSKKPNEVEKNDKEIHSSSLTTLTYGQRSEKIRNPIGRRLLELMESKKTNLSVAADVTTKAELLELADTVGPEICLLKTHADIITDWDENTGKALTEVARRHNFMVFEDRKFADIGNTVLHQVSGGVHSISQWADIVNAHAVPGPGIISALARASHNADENCSKPLGLILLAEMSSKGNLATGLPGYKERTIEMAKEDEGMVFGFISMGSIAGDNFVYMTPGVKLSVCGDGLGQQYTTPEEVIEKKGSDVIIVGRGIYEAADKLKAAKVYRRAGWVAYENRCNRLQ